VSVGWRDLRLRGRRDERPDPLGFTEQTRPLHGRLLQAARALCGDADLASDLAQETLVKAYRAWGTFTPGTPAYPWLARILRNVFIDHVRSAKVRREVPLEDEARLPADGTPLEGLLTAERVTALYAAIAQLPAEMALVITLVDLQGLSYAEVAQITEVPVGTVRSRLSRSRDRLRALLLAG